MNIGDDAEREMRRRIAEEQFQKWLALSIPDRMLAMLRADGECTVAHLMKASGTGIGAYMKGQEALRSLSDAMLIECDGSLSDMGTRVRSAGGRDGVVRRGEAPRL